MTKWFLIKLYYLEIQQKYKYVYNGIYLSLNILKNYSFSFALINSILISLPESQCPKFKGLNSKSKTELLEILQEIRELHNNKEIVSEELTDIKIKKQLRRVKYSTSIIYYFYIVAENKNILELLIALKNFLSH
jgi:hypothetical protein